MFIYTLAQSRSSLYARGGERWSWRATLLLSLAPTLKNPGEKIPNCILKSLISCFRCVWLGLELNSAGTPVLQDQRSPPLLYAEYASYVRPLKHQGAPCPQRCFNFSLVFEFGQPLWKHEWSYVVQSLAFTKKKRVESVPSRGRDTVSRALSVSVIQDVIPNTHTHTHTHTHTRPHSFA